MSLYKFTYFLAVVIFTIGALANDVRSQEVPAYDYKAHSAVEFLQFLKSVPKQDFVVTEAPRNWITEKDVAVLVIHVHSTERCASVRSEYSSYIGPSSTVGREAAFLIEGYRKGKYPPELNSVKFTYDPKELLSWFQNGHNKSAGTQASPRSE